MTSPKGLPPTNDPSVDEVAAAIDAAPYDDFPESEEERTAVAAARAEPDGFVPRDEVGRLLEAWARPKSA